MTNKNPRLFEIIFKQSFKYSKEPIFKLQSGKMSNFYIDVKQTTLSPEGSMLVGEAVFDIIKDKDVKAVGGLTLGADPIAMSTAFAALKNKKEIFPFIVRKEPKGHGTGKQIEAAFPFPQNVFVLDDVITSGESTIKAIEACKREGLNVKGVVCVIDREEGGKKKIEDTYQIPVYPLITKSELFAQANV